MHATLNDLCSLRGYAIALPPALCEDYTMKKRTNTPIFLILFTILCLPAKQLLAEEYIDIRHNFQLTYDNSLVPVEVMLHNVALALKSSENDFPTFNVVIENTGPVSESDFSTFRLDKSVLEGYHLVGIKNASLTSSKISEISSLKTYLAELAYSLDQTEMISSVAIFQGSDRQYVLTFIDKKSDFSSSKHIFESIVQSFSLLDKSSEHKIIHSAEYTDGFYMILAGALAAALLMLYLFKKR